MACLGKLVTMYLESLPNVHCSLFVCTRSFVDESVKFFGDGERLKASFVAGV